MRVVLIGLTVALIGYSGGGDTRDSTAATTEPVSVDLAEYDAYWHDLDSGQRDFQCQVFLSVGPEAPGARQLYDGMQGDGAIPATLAFDEWSEYLAEQCSD